MGCVYGRGLSAPPDGGKGAFRHQLERFGHVFAGGHVVPLEATTAELFIVHNGVEHWRHVAAGGTLDICGAIDPTSLSTEAWNHLVDSPADGLPTLAGSYLAVIRRPGGEIEVWTDAAGSIPLYWTVIRGVLAFGTENAFMLDGSDPVGRMDPVALASRMLFRVASFEHSVWRDIQLMPARTGLIVAADGSHRLVRWALPKWSSEWRTKDEFAEQYLELFRTSLSRELNRCRGHATGVYLSAGMDSRFIATNLHAVGARFPVVSFETGTIEVPVARKVAARLGLEFHQFPMDFDFHPDVGSDFLRTSSGELNLAYGFTVQLSRRIAEHYQYMWDGVLGDQHFPKDEMRWLEPVARSAPVEQVVDLVLLNCAQSIPTEIEKLRAHPGFEEGYGQLRGKLIEFFTNHRLQTWKATYRYFQREQGMIRRRSLLGVHNQRTFVSLCCPFLSHEQDRLAMSYLERHEDHLAMYAHILGLVNRSVLDLPLERRSMPGATRGLRHTLRMYARIALERLSPHGRRHSFAHRFARDVRTVYGPVLEDALRNSRLADAGMMDGDVVRHHLRHLLPGKLDRTFYMSAQILTLEQWIRLLEQRMIRT